MLKRCVIFIILLTLSISANANLTEGKNPAIADAEQDAERYNALHWGVMGAAAPVASTSASIAACMYIHSWVGYACGYGIPALAFRMTHIYKVTPPAARLIGKPLCRTYQNHKNL